MRRLVALNLTVMLLAPWIAALSGTAVPVVACPMHRAGGATSHNHAGAMVAEHGEEVEHHSPSKHGTSAESCNCVGECGRSGTAFTLSARVQLTASFSALLEATPVSEGFDFGSAARLLPDATGPPSVS